MDGQEDQTWRFKNGEDMDEFWHSFMPPENVVSDENGEYYIGEFIIEPNYEAEKDLKRVVAERISRNSEG